MVYARLETLLGAVLLVGSVLGPGHAAAQEPDVAPSADAEEAPVGEEDSDGDDWITPDVGAAEEREEDESMEDSDRTELEDASDIDQTVDAEDVDQVIVEYGDDTDKDLITDDKGREVPDVAMPIVSRAVEVQDPDKLEPNADKDTGVQGQVVSRRPKKVLPDAPVLARGDSDGKLRSTITDERGRYRLYLPPGKYTLRSYYDLYHGARWDNISVARGAFKRVNFILDPISEKDAGVEEMEVVYLADTTSEQAQLNIRKEQVTVADAISAEEIKRAGDSTAKGAAARVVGVTIDEDDRVIIRGLADRYNQILLNEMQVPGVDPDVPSVRLDIFPTDIVANLAVVKSPVPSLPGSFAGGLLLIDTTNYPRDFTLKVGGSMGVNSLSTFRQTPSYNGGKRDWIGYDDGTRALPAAVGNQRLDVGTAGSGTRYQSLDQVNEVGRQFPNNWNSGFRTALPKIGIKASVGDSGDLRKEDRRAGYIVSFLYEYEDAIRTGFNKRLRYNAEGQSDGVLQDFDLKAGNQNVLWGTFGSGFLELNKDNFLNLTTLFSRAAQDKTITQLGAREDTGLDVLTTKDSFNFIGRSIFFNQLTGDHRNLGDSKLRLQWNLTGGTGKRDEPDRREVQQFVGSQLVTAATRYYASLDQWFVGGLSSIRFPLYEAFERTSNLEVGVTGNYTDRNFEARRFVQQQLGNNRLVGDPEVLFDFENMGKISTIREVTRIEDSYLADQWLVGGYAQLETPIAPWLDFLGLLRFEAFTQQVTSQSPFAAGAFNPDLIRATNRTDLNPLPSATFRFKINEQQNVKLAYGMTVIRPAIRELAPFNYVDFIRGWNITGNPDLVSTVVQNVEARWEYYFGGSDLIAATAFYKYLDNPIEFVIQNQVNSTATFQNADRAWLAGGEVELRIGFERFHEKLDTLFFTGNVAFMQSKTFLPAGQGISGRLERALFNQSPFVTNLSLRFDDPDSGVLVAVVYNAFGPRIVEAGSAAGNFIIPDVFEQAQHLLDLVVSWQPTDHVKLGFKWRNIAFAKEQYKQGDELVLLENRGTTVSIGAEYIY